MKVMTLYTVVIGYITRPHFLKNSILTMIMMVFCRTFLFLTAWKNYTQKQKNKQTNKNNHQPTK